jgi:hypothetical protein
MSSRRLSPALLGALSGSKYQRTGFRLPVVQSDCLSVAAYGKNGSTRSSSGKGGSATNTDSCRRATPCEMDASPHVRANRAQSYCVGSSRRRCFCAFVLGATQGSSPIIGLREATTRFMGMRRCIVCQLLEVFLAESTFPVKVCVSPSRDTGLP